MKTFIRLAALALAILMAVSVVGCAREPIAITSVVWEDDTRGDNNNDTLSGEEVSGGPETPSNTPDDPGSETPTKIDIKGTKLVITSWSDSAEPKQNSRTYKQEVELIEQIKKDFNCDFEYYCIPDSIQYYSTFATQTMAGTKFGDIVAVPGDQGFPSAALNGYAHCLDKYFNWSSENYIDRYVNDALLLNGKHYYLAFSINMQGNAGSGIRFRKSLFSRFGVSTPHDYIKANNWNWTTFEELCKTMTRVDNGVQYYGMEQAPVWFTSNNVKTILKLDDGKYKFNLDSPDAIECIAFGKKIYDLGYCPKINASNLWDSGLVAMGDCSWYGFDGNEDVGFAYIPIGPRANDYVYEGGGLSLTVVPTTVKESMLEGICAVIDKYYSVQSWRSTPKQQLEFRHSDEYSLELAVDTVMRASTSSEWATYYPNTYRNVFWSDYGISDGMSPQAFVDSVKGAAQQEIDALWSELANLK